MCSFPLSNVKGERGIDTDSTAKEGDKDIRLL